MEASKWFDKKFDFSRQQGDLSGVVTRLEQTMKELEQVMRSLPDQVLDFKAAEKWSIKEHVGHLSLLEAIWRLRFLDIKNSQPQLTSADLENKATSEALFNAYHLHHLLATFQSERKETLALLVDMKEEEFLKASLHPRLQQRLRIIDLAYFIAEHDRHHLAHIRQIIQSFQ